VEAAHCGVPVLSGDYPAMRELDAQFGLGVAWMDAADPRDMARRLKAMEQRQVLRTAVPDAARAADGWQELAGAWWREVRECL